MKCDTVPALKNKKTLTSQSSPHAKDQLKDLRILLVDDSPDNQLMIDIFLRQQGAKVVLANDGNEGVVKALAEVFDAVLMDIQMPVMDGHEAVRALRKSGYRKPVIALTAHSPGDEFDRATESGFTDFVTKPIERQELFNTILRTLENS